MEKEQSPSGGQQVWLAELCSRSSQKVSAYHAIQMRICCGSCMYLDGAKPTLPRSALTSSMPLSCWPQRTPCSGRDYKSTYEQGLHRQRTCSLKLGEQQVQGPREAIANRGVRGDRPHFSDGDLRHSRQACHILLNSAALAGPGAVLSNSQCGAAQQRACADPAQGAMSSSTLRQEGAQTCLYQGSASIAAKRFDRALTL